MGFVGRLVRKELQIALNKRQDILLPVWFFILLIVLFSLAIGHDRAELNRLASAIIWVGFLLATFLTLERLFKDDYADGSLQQLLLLPCPLPLLIFFKVFCHWLVASVPLLCLTPLCLLLLGVETAEMALLLLTLLPGSLALHYIGAIGSALVVGINKGGMLLCLLIFPLYVPILIFSLAVLQAYHNGADYSGPFALVIAMVSGSMTLSPFITAAAIRLTIN